MQSDPRMQGMVSRMMSNPSVLNGIMQAVQSGQDPRAAMMSDPALMQILMEGVQMQAPGVGQLGQQGFARGLGAQFAAQAGPGASSNTRTAGGGSNNGGTNSSSSSNSNATTRNEEEDEADDLEDLDDIYSS